MLCHTIKQKRWGEIAVQLCCQERCRFSIGFKRAEGLTYHSTVKNLREELSSIDLHRVKQMLKITEVVFFWVAKDLMLI